MITRNHIIHYISPMSTIWYFQLTCVQHISLMMINSDIYSPHVISNWDHIHHVSAMFVIYHFWLRYVHHMSDMFTKYNLCSAYVMYKYHELPTFTIYQLCLTYIIIYHIYLVYVKSGWDMVIVYYIRLTYILSHIFTICNISLVYDTYLWYMSSLVGIYLPYVSDVYFKWHTFMI